jgi:hypothetical protein
MTTLVPLPTTPPDEVAHRWLTNRQALYALIVVVAVLAIAFGGLLSTAVGDQRDGLRYVGHRAGAQVMATSDLHLALSNMDAQIATVLLIGDASSTGILRDTALGTYERRREQADRDIQQATVAAAGDTEAEGQVQAVLRELGRYEALAAQAVLLDGNAHHRPGQAPRAALDLYRQAGEVMRTRLLPTADGLNASLLAALDHSDHTKRSHAKKSAVLAEVSGLVLIAALIALHITISRRFNRRLSPTVALGTLLALGAVVVSLLLLLSGDGDLRRAKTHDFDSMFALSQARAIGYDADADEFRYLVDPDGRPQFDQAFFGKSQRIALLSDVDARRYPGAIKEAGAAYKADRTPGRFGGYLGTEFGIAASAVERTAAEQALDRFVAYEQDHDRMRAMVERGDLASAIALKARSAGSTGTFRDYAASLDALTGQKQSWFTGHVRHGESTLTGWSVIPWLVMTAVIGLAGAGVRPRLREYR